MDQLEFGAKIRRYRKEKGLTIQALADQAHITPSMLSQIERDLANPSINTMKLISYALNVPLFQFFTTDSSHEEEFVVRKNRRRRLLATSDGTAYEYELLVPNSSGDIEFVIQRIKANCDSGDAIQTHNGEEVAYILYGQLDLTLGESSFTLDTGDSVRIPAMVPHLWANPTSEEAALIYALTPPCF